MANESVSRAFMNTAKDLSDAGKFGDAINTLQEVLKQYPNFIGARVLLGDVYWISGNAALERVELEQVIKSVPDNFGARRKLAIIYHRLGQFALAAECCLAVLKANPKDQEMRNLLTDLQTKMGPLTTTAAELPTATVRTRAPLSQPAPTDMEETVRTSSLREEEAEIDSVSLAELYVSQGHREKALAVYGRLADKDPDDPRFQLRLQELLGHDHREIADAEGQPPHETPGQARRKNQVRRLEGWLAVIRSRRQS